MKQVSCNLPNTDPRSEVKQSKDEAEAGSAGGKRNYQLYEILFFLKSTTASIFSLYLIVSRVGVKIRNKANAGWSFRSVSSSIMWFMTGQSFIIAAWLISVTARWVTEVRWRWKHMAGCRTLNVSFLSHTNILSFCSCAKLSAQTNWLHIIFTS